MGRVYDMRLLGVFAIAVVMTSPVIVNAVTLYEAEDPISSDSVDVRITSRSKRDVTSSLMADYYDVALDVNGERFTTRLHITDDVGDLDTYDENGPIPRESGPVYKRDWATYRSYVVDGAFLVHCDTDNTSRLVIEGHMIRNKSLYLLQPRDTPGDHVLHKLSLPLPDTNDDKRIFDVARTHGKKARRQTSSRLTVEVKVVMDTLMQAFVKLRVKNQPLNPFLKKYYASLIMWLNWRFDSILANRKPLRIVGKALEIRKTPIRSIEALDHFENRVSNFDRAYSCAVQTLKLFTSYTNGRVGDSWSYGRTPDHTMLLTGYDLLDEYGYDTPGRAYQSAICKGTSTSVVSCDAFSYQVHNAAAHQLGHSLGAVHDGEAGAKEKECKAILNYLMAKESSSQSELKIQFAKKVYVFSKCSKKRIQATIADIPDTYNCLMRTSYVQGLGDYRIGADMSNIDQCKFLHRDESSYIGVPKRGPLSDICSEGMLCKSTWEEAGTLYMPYDGTSCGHGKWCINMQCVPKQPGRRRK